MPILETPPNPASPQPEPPESRPAPIKVATRRFGELEEHELLHLLDSIDDEIAKARFRESIYVSVIFCLALGWLLFYGPRVLFHQGRLATPEEKVTQLDKKELPYLDLPKTLVHKVPPKPRAISDQDRVAQTPQPAPQPVEPARGAPAPPQPTPQPQAAPPQPAPQQQARQQSPPPQPQPRQLPSAPLPDAPHPIQQAANRPSFGTPSTPGQSIRDAANAAAHGSGGSFGTGAPHGRAAAASGVEVLSDTMGDDFQAYLKRMHDLLLSAWLPLIPEECAPPLNKEGTTIIRVTINRDGTIAAMHLDDSTHDRAIDRSAWGSFQSNGQFPPFPKNFKSSSVELRWTFVISHGNGSER